MRVSADTKRRTRERLLQVARKLFASRGFDDTTTRDISNAAKLAPGTLFNYFATKEALATALIAEALSAARDDFLAHRRAKAGLAEELFAHVLAGLKALEPFESYVGEVFAIALSPFAASAASDEAREMQRQHLATVAQLLGDHGFGEQATPATLQLYWTIYLGVLAAWTHDTSDHREETLALLDRTIDLFVASLDGDARTERDP